MRNGTTLAGVAGRYTLLSRIGSGGMATVHLGRARGAAGFSRTVAIKRLHSQFVNDPCFVAMFTDEARIASRIRHPNVTSVIDVVASDAELFLVMEYVHGAALSELIGASVRAGETVPLGIVGALMRDILAGLHAAHEVEEDGVPLQIVHRDVSPDNVIVSVDGVAQLVDFGVAKAVGRSQVTREGQIKGKLAFMPPEQLTARAIDRRVDVYAAAAVLWTMLTGKRLFSGDEANLVYQILHARVPAPSELAAHVSAELDAVVLRGLARDPDARFATALDMADALEDVLVAASPREVGAWVERVAGDALRRRAELRAEVEVGGDVDTGDAGPTLAVPGATPGGGQPGARPIGARDDGRAIRGRRSTLVFPALALALALAAVGVGTAMPSGQPALATSAGIAASVHEVAARVLATPAPAEEAQAEVAEEAEDDHALPVVPSAPGTGPARAARGSGSNAARRPSAPGAPASSAKQRTLPSGDRDYGF
jgi:eukaryotic-like serine/threonine-protein kinase